MNNIWQKLGPILSNPWIVGIGASTVSGVIVWWITQKLFSARENKEYLQKVLSANSEVLYALRPLIAELTFPSIAIVESVISATSKKFGVKKESMNSPMQFFDELIKEVMDSNFIDSRKKVEYCNHLYELKKEALSTTQPKAISTDLSASDIARKENMFNAISMSTGIMVALTTFFFSIGNFKGESLFANSLGNILLPVLAALIATFLTLFSYLISKNDYDGRILKRIFTQFEGRDEPEDKNKCI